MYIGDTGPSGLHHLFYEILDNGIDEVLAGRASEITAIVNADKSISIHDNGNGIPTGINAQTGLSGVELAMTKLNAGGKFGDGGYKVSGGLHGVGLSCVNFLSEWCEAIVDQNGHQYKLRCEKGIPTGRLQEIGPSVSYGTTITWVADPEIFGEYTYNTDLFESRIRNTCYLNPEVKIHFHDVLNGREPTTYYYERGIAEFVRHLNANLETIGNIMHVRTVYEDVLVDIALQYNRSDIETVLTYANSVDTKEGGTHLTGFYKALTRAVNSYAQRNGYLGPTNELIKESDIGKGLAAVVLVRLFDPKFEGATKSKLGNENVESIVHRVTAKALVEYLANDPLAAGAIVQKLIS
jgi:DNA gyrase subunit B